MTRKEFLNKAKVIEIRDDVKKKMHDVYGEKISTLILQILSFSPTPTLFDENESRTLSINEIINAEKGFGVPFKSNNYVPIAELGCDDYIIYNTETEKWCIYNIIDELVFDETSEFEELFLR